MLEEQYEFDFREITIGDWMQIQEWVADPKNPLKIVNLLQLAAKFTVNIDLMTQPLVEYQNFIKQFAVAFDQHLLVIRG